MMRLAQVNARKLPGDCHCQSIPKHLILNCQIYRYDLLISKPYANALADPRQ